jgi:tRNA dimethylallyltransferase
MEEKPRNLIVILGPTASGKTAVAVRLAKEVGAEIISADSRQVYRGMDIGTGKDLDEYRRAGVACHLIDLLGPEGEFSVYEYQREFFACFQRMRERGLIPVMAGGSGLYIESVLRNYLMAEAPADPLLRRDLDRLETEELKARLLELKPVLHNTTDFTDRERIIRAIEIAGRPPDAPSGGRPEIRPLVVGISCSREELKKKIGERLKKRLESGMIEEVEKLVSAGITWERLDRFGLEYRYVGLYLRGEMTRKEMADTLEIRIRRFAKRQMTWFRRMERLGIPIRWFPAGEYEQISDYVRHNLK